MTSAPYFSFSQGIATEVSRPPEYARAILSGKLGPLFEPPRERLGVAGIAGDDENRVVAGQSANNILELRAVDRKRQRLSHARAGADDDELLDAVHARRVFGERALQSDTGTGRHRWFGAGLLIGAVGRPLHEAH